MCTRTLSYGAPLLMIVLGCSGGETTESSKPPIGPVKLENVSVRSKNDALLDLSAGIEIGTKFKIVLTFSPPANVNNKSIRVQGKATFQRKGQEVLMQGTMTRSVELEDGQHEAELEFFAFDRKGDYVIRLFAADQEVSQRKLRIK